jgi:hypothetical protein
VSSLTVGSPALIKGLHLEPPSEVREIERLELLLDLKK